MNTNRLWLWACATWLCFCTCASHGQTDNSINNVVDNSQVFGRYEISYTAFNSQFISAETASAHKLVRAKDQALINVSVIDLKTGKTVRADVSGTAKNLIQQTKTLKFKAIEEPNAIYYIGVLRHSNEELFHFALNVAVDKKIYEVKFIRKLYTEP